ncbi:MAG: hypothetical protein CM15mP86_05380 [Gammaproteobacteria bacterium]|nr:MAG: hypothetical protein CM15mP86_05380 [Gammaproteobacteria bacterium]
MGRFITLSIPTVCAINGHAFGAGFMFALTHDVRVMREDRGFLCANEMQLGLPIPRPELALLDIKFQQMPSLRQFNYPRDGQDVMLFMQVLFKN